MRKAFVKEDRDVVLCALYKDGELTRFYRFPKELYTGSVVVGVVRFVKKDVGVFVDIGLKSDGLLHYRKGLKSGDRVLVRIETEPTEGRGCSLTEKIDLAGKYVVLLDREEYAFSSEISEEKKVELFSLPRQEGVGFIYRSLASEGTSEEIAEEKRLLTETYLSIKRKAETVVKPTFLYRPDGKKLAEDMAKYVEPFTSSVQKDIDGLTERKVEKDGVELVFDKTEAMTVVDVNFHKSDKRGERAIFEVDEIAVREFARQIRLRNIGGIIVLDYISLVAKEDRDRLFGILKEELKKDFVRCEVEHAERTGLFIVTRPHRYAV